MINVKYQIANMNLVNQILEDTLINLSNNLMKEKKYLIGNDICIYRINDFLGNTEKIFIINFYYEKTKYYDFKQNFLTKIILVDDQLNFIMDNIGQIFITELFIKSFSLFWDDLFSNVFKNLKMVYKNF